MLAVAVCAAAAYAQLDTERRVVGTPCRVSTTVTLGEGGSFRLLVAGFDPRIVVTLDSDGDRLGRLSAGTFVLGSGHVARIAPGGSVDIERVTPAAALEDAVPERASSRVELLLDHDDLAVHVDGVRVMRVVFAEVLPDELSVATIAQDGAVATPMDVTPLRAASNAPAWIWGPDEPGADDTLVFRRRVTLDAAPRLAQLAVTADNVAEVLVDDEVVLRDEVWQDVSWLDVTEWFDTPGEHELVVRATNESGPAGLLARLLLHDDAGGARAIVTDTSWTVDGHGAARVVADLGGAPYSSITERTLDRAAEAPRPPEASSLTVTDGFVVERLAVAAPHQGSWVSLCVDDRGRLITSDQRGAGLFRITPGDDERDTLVEAIPVPLSGAQGLCWHADALYVVTHGTSAITPGLHRVRDTDGDDVLDRVELLRELHGAHEHGWHAIVPEPRGDTLLVVAGNDSELPTPDASRVPLHWGEDQPLPRVFDPSGFMASARAPGGTIWRIDADATRWELVSSGYRNTYDVAFDARGEAFTFDADMEWDLGLPWYRPTRVCRVTSGSEYGWRTGSGKWPPRWPDGLPPVVDVGPGSPVGITFTHDAAFPESHRDVLLLGDWSYGRVLAVRFDEHGGASVEPFLSGRPFPVTDLVVNPADGALYLTTGGRDVPSGLYRVRADVPTDAEPRVVREASSTVALRRELEALHGGPVDGAVDRLWPHLAHDDRFVRYAARIALEWQPLDAWRERALAEPDVDARLTALLALVRAGTGDASLADDVYDALTELVVADLSPTQYVALLRVETLADLRLASPDGPRRAALLARHAPRFPTGHPGLDADVCARLVALGDPTLAPRALQRVDDSTTNEERLALLTSLRLLDAGWDDTLRWAFFETLGSLRGVGGGASHAGYVDALRDDALATFGSDAPTHWRRIYDDATPADEIDERRAVSRVSPLPVRTATKWTVDVALAAFESRAEPDIAAGRRHFATVGCADCHRVDGRGGAIGPDLTTAGRRFTPHDVVDAIVHPSRTVSDLYTPTIVVTHAGDVVVGQIANLVGDRIDVMTDMTRPGAVTSLRRGDIAELRRSTTSPMPEGLLAPLRADEVADLVAYVLAERR